MDSALAALTQMEDEETRLDRIREHAATFRWALTAILFIGGTLVFLVMILFMDLVAFTRKLVDIESITGNEAAVGEALYTELCRLGYQARKMPVEGTRFNVLATSPEEAHPAVVFSTHMPIRAKRNIARRRSGPWKCSREWPHSMGSSERRMGSRRCISRSLICKW